MFGYSTWFEIAALVISIFYIKKLQKPKTFLTLPIFLAITVIAELMGYYFGLHFKANRFIYNFYDPIFFGFFLFMIYKDVYHKNLKKISKFILLVFLLFAAANFAYYQGLDLFNFKSYLSFKFNKHTFIFGSVLVIFTSLLYYFDLILLISLKKRLEDNLTFWIATGGLFYCAGSILSTSLHEYIVSNKIMMHNTFMFTAISRMMSVILYGTLILGIYMHATKDKRNQKKIRKMEEESAKDAREIEELRNAILK
ncbi:MAG: CIR N-terminal domain-containing protein [Hydrotalea sp.]|nr:CIR N-terminal domain-containing protein [Hydrotalea sp.]